MDDIVVIILTILVAVVGALSQKKKRREAAAPKKPQPNQPDGPMSIWEILREQSSTGTHPFDEPEPMFEAVKEEPVDRVPEPRPAYQFSASSEGSSDIKEPILVEPKKKPHKVTIDGEKFSLRKAIIYSEIMNRKYT